MHCRGGHCPPVCRVLTFLKEFFPLARARTARPNGDRGCSHLAGNTQSGALYLPRPRGEVARRSRDGEGVCFSSLPSQSRCRVPAPPKGEPKRERCASQAFPSGEGAELARRMRREQPIITPMGSPHPSDSRSINASPLHKVLAPYVNTILSRRRLLKSLAFEVSPCPQTPHAL